MADIKGCKSVIFGLEGTKLTPAEKKFFAKTRPYGFILFARNVEKPAQVKRLIAELRDITGRADVPVLIDQEGGRVQRLREPHWFEAKPFAFFGDLHATNPDLASEALRLSSRLIAADLRACGITVNCTPCLDLRLPETVAAIGDRAFSDDPKVISLLGGIVAKEFLSLGIMPVIKHMPGHGRATVDSHLKLPRVATARKDLTDSDFAPFKALSLLPWGMTSHILFKALDAKYPATQSKIIVEEVIRGEIGFDGLLLTDDLNMEALSGSLAFRAETALAAGVDIILHCSGKMTEMQNIAVACPPLSPEAQGRIERSAPVFVLGAAPLDPAADRAALDHLLASV